MLPSCQAKINAAIEDVKILIEETASNESLLETEEWKAANKSLNDALAFVESI